MTFSKVSAPAPGGGATEPVSVDGLLAAGTGSAPPRPVPSPWSSWWHQGLGVTGLARAAGKQSPQLSRWRHSGLTLAQADEMACRIGLHPGEVWPEWWFDEDAGVAVGVAG